LHEREQVERLMGRHLGIKLITVRAEDRFLTALAGSLRRMAIGYATVVVIGIGAGLTLKYLRRAYISDAYTAVDPVFTRNGYSKSALGADLGDPAFWETAIKGLAEPLARYKKLLEGMKAPL